MHPPIPSRYMFNILYNVMIRLINYERFSTNDTGYLKLDDNMRGASFDKCATIEQCRCASWPRSPIRPITLCLKLDQYCAIDVVTCA